MKQFYRTAIKIPLEAVLCSLTTVFYSSSSHVPMASTTTNIKQVIFYLFATCGLITLPLFFYSFGNQSSTVCPTYFTKAPNVTEAKPEKPILLIWLWPFGFKFDIKDCMTYFNIDSCVLTDDRSLYSAADGVFFYQQTIDRKLNILPKGPRPAFQKWIWFNNESPTNTKRVVGFDDLFNLTMTFRQDSDITARYELSIVRSQEQFVLPQKKQIVCWISSNNAAGTGASTRLNYYHELKKHIDVKVYGRAVSGASFLRHEDYYSTIASCKFYLAFENSLHEGYITEKLNGPMASGTVPVVLGPSRENYEQVIPADSFIHVNDFPNPKALAEYLLQLNQNEDMYMRYFAWRKYFKATPHLLTVPKEFLQPICTACDHIANDNTYNVVNDLFWWYHKNLRGAW
ncbi:4-galactosyl-N-acetylglucosaminide 3-alpha-L-fucosyltransferase 9-like [Sardina pilchardus]|uniref:4-galactosyl-N-acetylglucosaminide 3-alpha-L-fucosyltransferase 9-like n=1 Tax=Sardina pilchardus TaxID=27697 RepID=UPI002E1256D9